MNATVGTPMTATVNDATTTLAPGTRVRVMNGAMWGAARNASSNVRGGIGVVNSGPDSDRDYSVTVADALGNTTTHWVAAEHLVLIEEEPDLATRNLPSGTRVYVPEGARWSQGPTGRPEGNWCTTLNAGTGPDRDGDYLVCTEDQENSGYVRWQDLQLEGPEVEPTPEPEPDTQEAETAALREAIAEMQAKWDALSEALNEKAKDQDWCGEYESVVQPLGFEGRVNEAKCYDVTVDVEYTWEADYNDTSRDIDSAVREQVGGPIDEMAITVRTSRSVSIHIDKETVGDRDLCCEDCIQEYIDSSMIETALDNDGSSYSSIDKWAISSYGECSDC